MRKIETEGEEMKKNIFLGIGWISLIVGTIGIFLPILPTTPFLLLSAYCFQKSSERFHNWMIQSPIFGKYIQDYQEKKGIRLRNKIISISFMAVGMSYSAYKVNHLHARIGLALIFVLVSWHICRIKTLKK